MTSSAATVAVARRAIVAGHGDFAEGIVSAVQQITGKGDAFRAISNRDLGADSLEQLIRAAVDANAVRVIFTDLPAGSCTIAARRVARDVPWLTVVSGANLSVLLAWALGTDDSATALERAVERGRGAMTVLPGPKEDVPAEGRGAH
jgi:PTS system N-acetylgalactosamine-specific IIA component